LKERSQVVEWTWEEESQGLIQDCVEEKLSLKYRENYLHQKGERCTSNGGEGKP
jgi:hypothetical protein